MAQSPRSKSEAKQSDSLRDAFHAISRRRWDFLCERWRSYLPAQFADMPDAYQPPSQDQVFIDRMRSVKIENAFETIDDAPIIRTLIFEAARYCADRCLYFTSIAEKLVVNGRPTGAITASYLAMIFGARSMLGLLGIYYCHVQNQSWLIDCWPNASETTSQGRLREWIASTKALISNRRMGHEHHWKLFIRLRAITTRLPVEDSALIVFRRLREHSDYSSHRNDIQYNDRWPYPDLIREFTDNGIGILPVDWDIRLSDLDHTLKMAELLTFSCTSMILSIIKPLPKFKDDYISIKENLSPRWHPLLNLGSLSDATARL